MQNIFKDKNHTVTEDCQVGQTLCIKEEHVGDGSKIIWPGGAGRCCWVKVF